MSIISELGIEDEPTLMNIHRLPRFTTNPEKEAHSIPIIVKLVRMQDRQTVFDTARKRKITIRTAFPTPLKKVRGKLAAKDFEMREKRQVQTKIFEKGKDVVLQWREKECKTLEDHRNRRPPCYSEVRVPRNVKLTKTIK